MTVQLANIPLIWLKKNPKEYDAIQQIYKKMFMIPNK